MSGGRTPLQIAAQNGHEAVVEILLKHGAPPRISQDNGKTALHLACFQGHERIVSVLLAHDSTAEFIQATDRRGRTALGIAASRGSSTTVRTLLEDGADHKELVTLATQRAGGDLTKLMVTLGL